MSDTYGSYILSIKCVFNTADSYIAVQNSPYIGTFRRIVRAKQLCEWSKHYFPIPL